MRTDQDILNDIGEVLISAAPENAVEIRYRAELSPEDDVCDHRPYFLDKKTGEPQWFSINSFVIGALMDLMIELRKYYVENWKSQEKSFWHSCVVTIDVEKLKIRLHFNYEPGYFNEGEEFFRNIEDDYNDEEDEK